jgi:hypothetical protein
VTRLVSRAAVLALVLAACGCSGEKKSRPAVPVEGQLIYKGGKKGPVPAAGALVVFNPVTQDDAKRPIYPKGTVQADGSFKLSTYADDDGAPEGEYGVTVVWKESQQKFGEDRGAGVDRLGGRYADPSNPRLKATVRAGQAGPIRLEVE